VQHSAGNSDSEILIFDCFVVFYGTKGRPMLQTAAVLPVQTHFFKFTLGGGGGRGGREGSILHVMPPLESIPGDATAPQLMTACENRKKSCLNNNL
jgi:hypothetical protein